MALALYTCPLYQFEDTMRSLHSQWLFGPEENAMLTWEMWQSTIRIRDARYLSGHASLPGHDE